MSINWLTIFAFLGGVVTYRLLYTLIRPVRLTAACLFMSVFIFIVPNLEIHSLFFPDQCPRNTPNSNDDPRTIADVRFQNFRREDHNFLDEILQKQNQDTAQVKRAELVTHKETVKRAQLVARSETFKHN